MSVRAQFVGGPLNGQVRVLSDARSSWYFPANMTRRMSSVVMQVDAPLVTHGGPPLEYRRQILHDPTRYENEQRRLVALREGVQAVYRLVA